MKVRFGGGDGGWFTSEFKLKQKDTIYVVQIYPPQYRENFRKSDIKLKDFMCLSLGSISIQAGFEKTVYAPGELAKFQMTVDAAESDAKVEDVQGQCNRVVTVSCKGHKQVWEEKVDRCSAGGLAKGDKTTTLTMTPVIRADVSTMTTIGTLIRCEYNLSAVCKMGFVCSQERNPAIRLPILVCQFPTQEQQQGMLKMIQYPQGWNPQSMQPITANLQVNNASQYPNYYGGGGGGQLMNQNSKGYNPVMNPGDPSSSARNLNSNEPINPRAMFNLNYPQSPDDLNIQQRNQNQIPGARQAHQKKEWVAKQFTQQ